MSKFLSFETKENGTVLFPLGDGCVSVIVDPNILAISNGILTVFCKVRNMSQSLIDSINVAQVDAFETSWTRSVSVVNIPSGTTIDSVSFGEGPGPGPSPDTCDYQITVSESAEFPVNIIYSTHGDIQSITVPIGDNAILNEIDCFPQPEIDPNQSPFPDKNEVSIVELT
jgi:hypothetical protein